MSTAGDFLQNWPLEAPPQSGFMGYIGDVISAPFRPFPLGLAGASMRRYERQRRAYLFRLIVFAVALVIGVVMIPLSLIAHQPDYAMLLASGLVVCVVSLAMIPHLRLFRIAAPLFLFGFLFLGLLFPFVNPAGLDIQALLVYNTLVLIPLIAGLILPPIFVWITLFVLLGGTVAGVLNVPFSSQLTPLVGGLMNDTDLRISILAILGPDQLLLGLVGWMNTRSNESGILSAVRAIQRERELSTLKDQFLIAANHELRTPIMTWYNNVEIMSMLGARANDEQRARLLERSLASGKSVLRLLSTVLDAGALEVGMPQMKLKPVNVSALVMSVIETFDPQAIGEPGLEDVSLQSRDIRIDVPEGLWVIADEDRLRQILINLMTNALKYSEPGTPIDIVAVSGLPHRNEQTRGKRTGRAARQPEPSPSTLNTESIITIGVRDFGLGVPRHDVPKLFQRFVRLERDIAGSVRGTGVGLYLCRIFVEAMHGRIWVESTGIPGEGSSFYFALPCASTQSVDGAIVVD